MARQFKSNFLESLRGKKNGSTSHGWSAGLRPEAATRSSFRSSPFIISPFTQLCFFTNFDFSTWDPFVGSSRPATYRVLYSYARRFEETDKTKKKLYYSLHGIDVMLGRCRGQFCGQFSILVENNSKLLHDDLVNNNIIELHRDSTINYQFIILNRWLSLWKFCQKYTLIECKEYRSIYLKLFLIIMERNIDRYIIWNLFLIIVIISNDMINW